MTLASKDYFPGAKKLFESIKAHTKSEDYSCILLSNETSSRDYFGSLFDEIVELPVLVDSIVSSENVPRFRFTLHKLFVLEFLDFSHFDRVVFFDSDLMCLSSLDYLFEPELNDFDLLAVRDFACNQYYSKEIAKLNLDSGQIFNSGCFILNRRILTTLNYQDLTSLVSNSDISYDGGDQGYFNYIVQNSNLAFGQLPLKFNYPLDTNYPRIWRAPALVHFSGSKPWDSAHSIHKWDRAFYRLWGKGQEVSWSQNSLFAHPNVLWWFRNVQVVMHKIDVTFRLTCIQTKKRWRRSAI